MKRYRSYIIVSLAWIILFGAYLLLDRWPHPPPVQVLDPAVTIAPPTAALIQVHVAGAVRQPGVYALPADSRLIQAVEAAGGLTEQADPDQSNLAEHLADGQQVYIAGRGTVAPPAPTPLAQPVRGGAVPLSDGLVNINTATAAELDTLPGIGAALSSRIVTYRDAHGPFAEPSDLVQVDGIGPSLYERIKDLITVR